MPMRRVDVLLQFFFIFNLLHSTYTSAIKIYEHVEQQSKSFWFNILVTKMVSVCLMLTD